MPASPRARLASNRKTQINAQFAFAEFPLEHLLEDESHRSPDYKYPDPNNETKRRAMVFFSHEKLTPSVPPKDRDVTYDQSGDVPGPQTAARIDSTHAGWIANWSVFAAEGHPTLKALDAKAQSWVEVEVPGGRISSLFRCRQEQLARAQFLYGPDPETRHYAHEAVVELEYPDTQETFTLHSESLNGGSPMDLVFTWGDEKTLEIIIGNGAAQSLESIRTDRMCGHDHETLTDFEFELLRDVVECQPDPHERFPVPRVVAREIRQIPCIVSSIAEPQSETEVLRVADADRTARPSSARTAPAARTIRPADLQETLITDLLGDVGRAARTANYMCRLIPHGSNETLATGFLIGPDLVMTAAHVFFNADGSLIDRARAASVRAIFDQVEVHKGMVTVLERVPCPLAQDWAVDPVLQDHKATRDVETLDYAVIRLARRVGEEQIGSAEARGHFPWPPNPASIALLRNDVFVRIMQHHRDADGALQSAIGVIRSVRPQRMRVGYTASTLDGSSGSAVLDQNFQLVALHVGGSDENFPRQNQGLPIRWILRDLQERNNAALLQPSPPPPPQEEKADYEDMPEVVARAS